MNAVAIITETVLRSLVWVGMFFPVLIPLWMIQHFREEKKKNPS